MDENPLRFVVFNNDGVYQEDIPMAMKYFPDLGKFYFAKLVGNGIFVAQQNRKDLPPQGIIFSINPPKIIAKYPFQSRQIIDNYVSEYYGENCFFDSDSRHIVFGDSQIFKFSVFDLKGNLVLEVNDKKRSMTKFAPNEMKIIIDEDFTHKPGASEVRKSILNEILANKRKLNRIIEDIEAHKNVIADIRINGDRIYIFPVRRDISLSHKYPVEIYNLKGELIKYGYFPQIPAKIYRDDLYFYARDQEDNPLIERYRFVEK